MTPLEIEQYEERRRKWRRSAFWRGFLVAAVLAIILGLALTVRPDRHAKPHIARFAVEGLIVDDPARDRLLTEMAESDDVRAVILRINSTGGTTTGAEALFDSLRTLGEAKPVVATMGEVAASGGYAAALAADHIVARGNTLTGSVGVIMEYPDLSGLMQRIGVEMETFRSSPLKADVSPLRPITPEGRAAQDALIADSYGWFRGLVAERRQLDEAALDRVANGAVFTGRMALERGLVDEIGGEAEARAHLDATDPDLAELAVEDWEVAYREEGLIPALLGRLGILSPFRQLGRADATPGLLSVLK